MKQVIGIGLLGGIGFTMSIFITLLACDNPNLITESKLAIICFTYRKVTLSYLSLRATLKLQNTEIEKRKTEKLNISVNNYPT